MNTPFWWRHNNIIATLIASLLWPLSIAWRIGTALRKLFATKERLSIPVWCVGNVTAGGGGKTPFCLTLGEQMKSANINAYFISRGYGGKLTGPVLVDPQTHNSDDIGDEALLLANCLPTIACHKRIEAARFAQAQGAELIIMDDGLQYPHLRKDKSFLLLKGDTPLGNGYVIPAGPLRESFANAKSRGDIIVRVDSTSPLNTDKLPVWQATTKLSLPELPNKKIVAFAGIAHPEHFKRDLENAGCEVLEFHAFGDHYAYSEKDLNRLIASAKKHQATLITTAKDAVRIPESLKEHIVIATQSMQLQEAQLLDQLITDLKATQ